MTTRIAASLVLFTLAVVTAVGAVVASAWLLAPAMWLFVLAAAELMDTDEDEPEDRVASPEERSAILRDLVNRVVISIEGSKEAKDKLLGK
jgi:hypothetical protein